MQQLAVEQRRLLGPRAPWHVGDIAWGLRQHEGREDEWRIRLWVEGGTVAAWSWLKDDGRALLKHDVHPEHLHLLDEILAEPAAQVAFAFEDDVDRIAKRARPCVVTVIAQRIVSRPGSPRRTNSRVGTGVAVSANGVLTTASVVLGAEHVFVVTDNHLQVEAHIVGMDPVRNLALI